MCMYIYIYIYIPATQCTATLGRCLGVSRTRPVPVCVRCQIIYKYRCVYDHIYIHECLRDLTPYTMVPVCV